MVTELKLSGNRLIIYALIHGFCKDGVHEFTGSINYICEWTNLSRNTVISTLKSLVDDELIVKRDFQENNVKFCSYSLGSAKIAPVVKKTTEGSAEIDFGGSAEIAPNNVLVKTNTYNKEEKENKDNIIAERKEKDEVFIEKIYKLYPTKCPIRGTSLSKSHADKKRIKALLKKYTKEQILMVVENEIKNKYGKYSLKNFSTFLNNFPDPSEMCENSTPKQYTLFDNLPTGMIIRETQEERNKKLKNENGW